MELFNSFVLSAWFHRRPFGKEKAALRRSGCEGHYCSACRWIMYVRAREPRSKPNVKLLRLPLRSAHVPYTCRRFAEIADLAFLAVIGIRNFRLFNGLAFFESHAVHQSSPVIRSPVMKSRDCSMRRLSMPGTSSRSRNKESFPVLFGY